MCQLQLHGIIYEELQVWACGVAATLPRSAYYDALQLNYYVREAFATGWLLLRGN